MAKVYIYPPRATVEDLNTNGYGVLEVFDCVVHEELNGEYSATIQIHEDAKNADKIEYDALIKCMTPRGMDYFWITKPSLSVDPSSRMKTAFAWHISYMLGLDMIWNSAWTGRTGQEALSGILVSGEFERRFSGTSDIPLITNMRAVRTSVLASLVNTEQDNCFLNRWGGEVERFRFSFNVKKRIGADTGFSIRAGKNLTGLAVDEDADSIVTRFVPSALTENDVALYLPERYINSERINDYPYPRMFGQHFGDIKVGAEDEDGSIPYPTTESAYTAMRNRVAVIFAAGADLPKISVDINFLQIEQKNIPQYAKLKLGDSVKCTYKERDYNMRATAYEYNSLRERYETTTLGDIKPGVGQSMWAQDVNLMALQNDMTNMVRQGERYNNVYINHEDGFVSEAKMAGYDIKVTQNATDGISIFRNGQKIFYTDSRTGRLVISSGESIGDLDVIRNDVQQTVSDLNSVEVNLAAVSGTVYQLDRDLVEIGDVVDVLDEQALMKGVSYAGAAISPASGFTSSAVVGGRNIIVNMSAAAGGMRITDNGVMIGGLAQIANQMFLIAGALTNNPSSGYHGKVGQINVGGNTVNGYAFYHNATFLFFMGSWDTAHGEVMTGIFDNRQNLRLSFMGGSDTTFYSETGRQMALMSDLGVLFSRPVGGSYDLGTDTQGVFIRGPGLQKRYL